MRIQYRFQERNEGLYCGFGYDEYAFHIHRHQDEWNASQRPVYEPHPSPALKGKRAGQIARDTTEYQPQRRGLFHRGRICH